MKNKKGKIPGWAWFLIIILVVAGIVLYISLTGDNGGAENLLTNTSSGTSGSGLQPPALPN